ncbi:MAG: hypothetical protein ABSA68_02535 [Xanthobacteraceae bacterium]|jgi:hypothetical protein
MSMTRDELDNALTQAHQGWFFALRRGDETEIALWEERIAAWRRQLEASPPNQAESLRDLLT